MRTPTRSLPGGSGMSMRSRVARGLLTAIAVSILVLLSACTGGGSSSGESGSGELQPLSERPDVTIAMPYVSSLDPSKGEPDYRLFSAYEPLIWHDRNDQAQPGLAVEFGYVGDGNTRFRLKLRDGVRFSDGEPLTADAVKTWFEYMAKGTSVGVGKMPAFESFNIVDDLTLEFTLEEPSPIVPYLLSERGVSWGFVASPKAVTQTPELLSTETFGTGAYKIDSARTVPDSEYVLVPNEFYYDQDAIRFSSISIKAISDTTTGISAMQSGQIELAAGELASLEAARSAGLTVVSAPDVGIFSPGLYLRDWEGKVVPALGDVRVRQALNYAIDRQAIAGIFGLGPEYALDQVITADGFDEEYLGHYDYDPDKARGLLEEAGYPDGFSFEVVFFDANQAHGINASTLVQAVAGYLEEIGVKVELRPVSSVGQFIDAVGDPTVAVTQSIVPPEPMYNAWTAAFAPESFMNPLATTDPVLADLVKQGSVAPPDEAAEIWKQMSRHVVDQAYLLPVFSSERYVYLSADLAETFGVSDGEPFSLWNQFGTSNRAY
jgi:peptide/nickel transport system substrate-binding protein